jgi:hypothetical protein
VAGAAAAGVTASDDQHQTCKSNPETET